MNGIVGVDEVSQTPHTLLLLTLPPNGTVFDLIHFKATALSDEDEYLIWETT